jgi:hypothetical protein
MSIVLMGDVVDTICGIFYEHYIYGDDMVGRETLSKLFEEWEKLERKTTMILDQKLSEITGKKKPLSNHV